MFRRESVDDRPPLGRRTQSARATSASAGRAPSPLHPSTYRSLARPPIIQPIPPVPALPRARKDAVTWMSPGEDRPRMRARRLTAGEVDLDDARQDARRGSDNRAEDATSSRSVRSLAVGGSSSRRAPSDARSTPSRSAVSSRSRYPGKAPSRTTWKHSSSDPRGRRVHESSLSDMSAPTLSALGAPSPAFAGSPVTTPQQSPALSDSHGANSPRYTPSLASSSTLKASAAASPSVRSTRSTTSSRSPADPAATQPASRPRRLVMPKQIKDPVVPWDQPGSHKMEVAKTSSLYCSLTPMYGHPPPVLKAHTTTLVGDHIYVIGGATSSRGPCFPGVAAFGIHTMRWDQLRNVKGDLPPPIRAHTSTAIGHTIWVYGGGDEMTYSSDMYAFNTITHTWTLPPLNPSSPRPVARRAHSAAFSPPHSIVVFGGGDGHAALNDTWVFNTVDLTWEEIISPCAPGEEGQIGKDGKPKRGPVPERRGYHSGHVVDGKLVIFGGGNGQKTFDAVEVLDLKTKVWHTISPPTDMRSRRRAYHAATVIGNLLVVVGGHDAKGYCSGLLCFDLRRKRWTDKHLAGSLYPGRGYHSATAADGRVFVLGGSDEQTFFSDMWTIDLGASAGLAHLNPVLIHLDT